MKNSSLSPSRDVYHSPKTITRFPPSDRIWEETLRGDAVPHPKKSPHFQSPAIETDLNELITESLAQLRSSRTSLQGLSTYSPSPSKAALKDPAEVEMLLKAAEEVKQKWSQRQSLNGQQGPLTPNSRKLLVQRMIERTRKKTENGEASDQRVETEPAKQVGWEEEEQPCISPSPTRFRTEESPVRQAPAAAGDASPVRKLRAELKAYREKYRKIESMYAALLTHRDHENPQNKYKRLYESLRQKYTHDQVNFTQKQWEMQVLTLKRQLEQKNTECRALNMQLNEQVRDTAGVARLQRDIEEMKLRVTRTEQDNEVLKAQLGNLQAK